MVPLYIPDIGFSLLTRVYLDVESSFGKGNVTHLFFCTQLLVNLCIVRQWIVL